jgi:hypothetical protein
VDTHFSSIPLGDSIHIDFSLGALIPGAILMGSFLLVPLCLFLSLYPIHLMLLPGDKLSFSSFVLLIFELPGLS